MRRDELEHLLTVLPAADSRNLFFTGKFLSPRDLADEQLYFQTRRQLHNRLLHGTGIVAGFSVEPEPHCNDILVIHPGMAIDGAGRELILRATRQVRVPLPVEEDKCGSKVTGLAGDLFLVARYEETEAETVPVLVQPPDDALPQTAANRVVEGVALEFVDPAQIPQELWREPSPRPGQGGLANQAYASAVPLARLTAIPQEADRPRGAQAPPFFEIDTAGRMELPPSRTVITAMSWPHGGSLSLDSLAQGLEAEFSRALLPESVPNQAWRVCFDDDQGLCRALAPAPGSSSQRDEQPTVISFAPDPGKLEAVRPLLVGATLQVTLRCEFILDRQGQAVDGTFLGGALPSGGGFPGSTFRSWFRLE